MSKGTKELISVLISIVIFSYAWCILKNNELSDKYYKMAEMKINEIKANMDI